MFNSLGQALAVCVAAIALFNTISALTLPVPERKPEPALVIVWLVLLLLHASLYWLGPRIRRRWGTWAYIASQATIITAVGVSGALFPVGVGLFIGLTAEAVILVGHVWGTVWITLGAVLLFTANAMIAADMYRGATAGLILATTGVVAHAAAALLGQRSRTPLEVASAGLPPASQPFVLLPDTPDLTPREREVLQALTSGARSSAIASELGISERTVKAHLASIYRKLGVDSRAAAVAAAMQRQQN